MQRHDLSTFYKGCFEYTELLPYSHGDWVKFSDVEPLIAEHSELVTLIRQLYDKFPPGHRYSPKEMLEYCLDNAEILESHKTITKLQNELDLAEEELNDMCRQNDRLLSEIDSLEEEIKNLEEELEDLR